MEQGAQHECMRTLTAPRKASLDSGRQEASPCRTQWLFRDRASSGCPFEETLFGGDRARASSSVPGSSERGSRQSRKAHRTASVVLNNREKHLPVEPVQTHLVDIQHGKGLGHFLGDLSVAFGPVPKSRTLRRETVRYPRRPRDRLAISIPPALIERYVKYLGGPLDYLSWLFVAVSHSSLS